MNKMFELTGKVALVVGGHGGLRKAIALAMADAGADVVVASRNLDTLNTSEMRWCGTFPRRSCP